MTNDERREAADWFRNRYRSTNMPGASKMFRRAEEALREGLDDEQDEPERNLIRCKDCKHRDMEKGFCEGRGWPMQLVPDNGFCDKAEKHTDKMHKLTNAYVVGETSLGGETA